MKRLVLLPLLLAPTLAHAACHHYSRWYYPFPQPRCGTGVQAHTTKEADHSWYVEIVLPDVDLDRAQALQKLKDQLQK
jgi:hypothetical protein